MAFLLKEHPHIILAVFYTVLLQEHVLNFFLTPNKQNCNLRKAVNSVMWLSTQTKRLQYLFSHPKHISNKILFHILEGAEADLQSVSLKRQHKKVQGVYVGLFLCNASFH